MTWIDLKKRILGTHEGFEPTARMKSLRHIILDPMDDDSGVVAGNFLMEAGDREEKVYMKELPGGKVRVIASRRAMTGPGWKKARHVEDIVGDEWGSI